MRHRPIRRVMLTVPPAPGIRPSANSGRPSTASGWQLTRPQKAAISSPLPCTWPWISARHAGPSRSVISASASAGLCRVRARCAVAGSANVPNSARSPPLQNDGPLPASTTSRIDGSRRATSSASSSAARASVENALCRATRLNLIVNRSSTRCATTGSERSGTVAGPRSVSQRANSVPDCSVEYASDSVTTPANVDPAGSSARSTSSHTADACGHRATRAAMSATAASTEFTVTARASSQVRSVSENVASSAEVAATSSPSATRTCFTSTSLSAPACRACRYRCAEAAPRTTATAGTCSARVARAASR